MALPGLQGNRKFKRLARALDDIAYGETRVRGFGQALAIGSLELLWESCYSNLDDVIGDPDDIEDTAGWNGEKGVLFAALRDAGGTEGGAGFIEECPDKPGVWRVHDLWDHAPEFVSRQLKRKIAREQNGETISKLRAEAGRKGGLARAAHLQASGKQTADTCQANVATNAPSLPAPPLPVKKPTASKPEADASWERVNEVWSRVCVPAGFARARGTEGQRKAARTRMREQGWFEAFQTACAYAASEPFYRGASSSGWTADLAWFLKPGNAEKTAERAETKRAKPGTEPIPPEWQRALAEADAYASGKLEILTPKIDPAEYGPPSEPLPPDESDPFHRETHRLLSDLLRKPEGRP